MTVPAGEFAALTPDSYITISIKTDESLADVEGHSYWVIKPMINDAGWPLITGITELPLSEDGSSYVIEPGAEAVTFSIPADQLEHVQLAGIAFMGHGVTLETLDITDEPPAAAIPEDTVKENPNTGVEGAAGIAAIGVIGAAVMFISRKRK